MKALPIILDIVVEQYKQIILRNTSETLSSEKRCRQNDVNDTFTFKSF